MTQPVMEYCGRGDAGGLELLLDDELLHGAGVAPPRLGPVRHDVARSRSWRRAAPRRRGPCTRSAKARTSSRMGSASGGRSMVRARRVPARTRSVTSRAAASPSTTASSAVARRRYRWASCSQVKPMPPCTWMLSCAHSSAGGERQRGRHGRGVGELVAALLGRPGRVPHGAGGQLGGHEHVGAVVLDGLEGGDGPAELHAHLGVGGGLLGALGGDAGRLGRDDEPGQVDQHPPPAGDAPRAGAPSSVTRAARRVGSRLRRHARRCTPPADVVDDDGVVARGQDEDLGEATAQDRRRRPGGRASRHRDVGRRARRRRRRSRRPGPAAAVPPARPEPAASMHGAGDHGRHEGPRAQGAAELLDHDDQLGQPEARAAALPRAGAGPASPARRGRPRTAGSSSVSASSSARAAPRASRLARKSEAVCPRARWSSVMAIGMA